MAHKFNDELNSKKGSETEAQSSNKHNDSGGIELEIDFDKLDDQPSANKSMPSLS